MYWVLLIILVLIIAYLIRNELVKPIKQVKFGGSPVRQVKSGNLVKIAVIGDVIPDYCKTPRTRVKKLPASVEAIHKFQPDWIVTIGPNWTVARDYEREYPQQLIGMIHHQAVLNAGSIIEFPNALLVDPSPQVEGLGRIVGASEISGYLN